MDLDTKPGIRLLLRLIGASLRVFRAALRAAKAEHAALRAESDAVAAFGAVDAAERRLAELVTAQEDAEHIAGEASRQANALSAAATGRLAKLLEAAE